MTTLPVELLLAFGLMAVACDRCGAVVRSHHRSRHQQRRVYFFRLNNPSKMPRRDFPVKATASRLVSIRKYLHRFRKWLTGSSI